MYRSRTDDQSSIDAMREQLETAITVVYRYSTRVPTAAVQDLYGGASRCLKTSHQGYNFSYTDILVAMRFARVSLALYHSLDEA